MSDKNFFESFMSHELVFDETVGFDEFLRDEGLELIGAYRSIESETVRKGLRDLIVMIAAEENIKRRTG